MSNIQKIKLVDATEEEKKKVLNICQRAIIAVTILSLFIVSCVACSMETDPQIYEMTDEQKATYWTGSVLDVYWYVMVDDNHNGILKGLYAPRDVKTTYDTNTRKLLLYFMFDPSNVMDCAQLTITSEYGKLTFDSEDEWTVKFSEKNDIKYLTITDSDGKIVYYSDRP